MKSKIEDKTWRWAYDAYALGAPIAGIRTSSPLIEAAYPTTKHFYRALLAYMGRAKLPGREA